MIDKYFTLYIFTPHVAKTSSWELILWMRCTDFRELQFEPIETAPSYVRQNKYTLHMQNKTQQYHILQLNVKLKSHLK